MDIRLRAKILGLYQKYKEEDQSKENRLDRWRNLEPESAEFISIIIRGQRSKNVLEIGTSNGFSTMWFADAIRSTRGKLVSIEIEKSRTILAQSSLTELGLIENVELLTIDAEDYLAQAGPDFDIVFLDAERKYYTTYWPDLKRLLDKEGALLLVDNVISHQNQCKDFINLVLTDSDFIHSIINVGAGILMVTKNRIH